MKKTKTIKSLILALAKREGLKKQVDIAQITEIVGHIADIVYESDDTYPIWKMFYELGEKRAKKKAKKK